MTMTRRDREKTMKTTASTETMFEISAARRLQISNALEILAEAYSDEYADLEARLMSGTISIPEKNKLDALRAAFVAATNLRDRDGWDLDLPQGSEPRHVVRGD